MKKLLFIAILLLTADISASGLRFFPTERIASNPHSALLRSPAVDVQYTSSAKDGKDFAFYNFGAKFGVLYFHTGNGIEYELSGYGGAFTRFELFSESFNFVHADFLGGGSFDIKYKSITFESMLYHNSSHLGDDYIHYDNGTYRNVDFEAIKLYTTINIFPVFDVSIGFEYKLHRTPDSVIFYNKSFLLGNRTDLLSKGIPVFFDCEIEITGFDHSPNIGARLGVFLNYLFNVAVFDNEASKKELHEFAVQYYYGYSKAGYFYNKKECLFLAGPTYRF